MKKLIFVFFISTFFSNAIAGPKIYQEIEMRIEYIKNYGKNGKSTKVEHDEVYHEGTYQRHGSIRHDKRLQL